MNLSPFYTSKEIKPCGWLRRQLEIEASGLAGNLYKVWPDIRESKWIGGCCEGWERVPYWLDGFIPLAYLLEDTEMISVAKKYIDAIIEKQEDDGWICPCGKEERSTYDTWALQLISKTLTVYYDCSGDERIPEVLYRAMKNYYELLSSGEIHLFNWGYRRWFEAFVALNMLDEKYGEEWIRELAVLLDENGLDYDEFTDRWIRPLNVWTHETHVVNLAMMLKTEAVTDKLLKGKYRGRAKKHYDSLMKYNGRPVGIFTGDECLAGLSASHGTELCAVAEIMYSYEWLFAVTKDTGWADCLELAAFNALPATISDDMWFHQYDQMTNQISTEHFSGKPIFTTNNIDAHLFGMEPNYGCCTANFGQAWPKFALSAFMKDGDDIISAVPVPSCLCDNGVKITLDSEYPFRNTLVYSVKTDRDFRLKIRIPGGVEIVESDENTVREGNFISVEFKAGEERTVTVKFSFTPQFVDTANGLKSAVCGSLVFALPVPYETRLFDRGNNPDTRFSYHVYGQHPFCDYEFIGKGEWQYGFWGSRLICEEHGVPSVPFSSVDPAVTLRVELSRINWGYEDYYDTVAATVPESTEAISEPEEKTLIPYGAAKLRMTEMPMCK